MSEFCSRNCAGGWKSREFRRSACSCRRSFRLPPRDAEWVERNVATLQKMGIGIENFGANSFRVDTLPAFLEIADAAEFLRKVIDELKTTSRSSSPSASGRRHDRENGLPSRRQS